MEDERTPTQRPEKATNGGTNTRSPEKVTIETAEAKEGVPGGRITLDENVVATIAGLAARRITGIHELGKWRFIPGDSPTRGVAAEVGKKQAAFDIDVVIDYGCDIREVASDLRQLIASEVDKMARRQVVEVNINVVGLHQPEDDANRGAAPPRVL